MNLTFLFILAEVEEVTHPNRYLAIATSGGLNQQRTGVSVFTFVAFLIIMIGLIVVESFRNDV